MDASAEADNASSVSAATTIDYAQVLAEEEAYLAEVALLEARLVESNFTEDQRELILEVGLRNLRNRYPGVTRL